MNWQLFEDVFRYAHLIDLDFSTWDQAVRMVVVTVDGVAVSQDRLPVYVVEFQRVHEMNVSFRHYGFSADSGHFQWIVDHAKAEVDHELVRAEFSGVGHFPVTRLSYEDVEIRRLDNASVDRAFPQWNRPGSPLLRASVEGFLAEDAKRRAR